MQKQKVVLQKSTKSRIQFSLDGIKLKNTNSYFLAFCTDFEDKQNKTKNSSMKSAFCNQIEILSLLVFSSLVLSGKKGVVHKRRK